MLLVESKFYVLLFRPFCIYIGVMNTEFVGSYVRGLFEMRRQNFDLAIEAFSKSGNYPGSKRQIANAIEGLGGSPQEICAALLTAFEEGDLRALPWFVFEATKNALEFPELKAYQSELEKLIRNENPEVVGTQARLLLINGDFKKGVALLDKAIKFNDPAARTLLAYICMSKEIDSKLLKLIKKIGAKRIFNESNILEESNISYVKSLLNQGELQNFYGANLALLQLNLETNNSDWISVHALELISNPELHPSLWNDPEYLAELSIEWLKTNKEANLSEIVERMKDFSLDEIFMEIINDFQMEIENESLFDDIFEDDDSIEVPTISSGADTSIHEDAFAIFGSDLEIGDFLEILEREDFNEFTKKSEQLLESAFQGQEKDFEQASQLVQFVIEKGANFGSFKRYSFYLQTISIVKSFENQNISTAFINHLVPRLLITKPIDGGSKKKITPETYEGLFQAIYFKNGLPSSISNSIESAFPNHIKLWDLARRIIYYADEVSNGNFSHLDEFNEVIRSYYPSYQEFESSYFTEDWLWYVSVHETIDLALENHDAIKSHNFREFVLSLIELDSHFGCKLVYADLWGPSGGYDGLSKNNSHKLSLTSEQLVKVMEHGTCDEDTGRDDSCLSNFTLVALHPNSTSETLNLILGQDHYDSAAKWAVARNPNASDETLLELAQSAENSWRVIGLIESEMLNLKPLRDFSAEVQSYVAFAVAINASSTDLVLERILKIDPELKSWTDVQLRNTGSNKSLSANEVVAQIKSAARR